VHTKSKRVEDELAALSKQHWSPEVAQRVLEACEGGGLSQARFCREHGLQAKRLSWWRKRLRAWGAVPAAAERVRFAPAVVRGTAPTQIQIRLPGEVAIEISGASASFVASVVSELRGSSL